MESYEHAVDTLERELGGVADTFAGLSDDEWQMEAKLVPLDTELPHWTIFELAGHFDISIGLTRMLIADPQPGGQTGRDRTSFFIFPRSEVAPVVYDYAYKMVEGKSPTDMPDVLRETFSKTIAEARANPADTVGPGYYALMRLDEFVTSRVVEAVDTRARPHRRPGHRPARQRRGGRHCGRDPRRPARTSNRRRPARGSRRRSRVDPSGLGTRRARRSAPADHRLTAPLSRSSSPLVVGMT